MAHALPTTGFVARFLEDDRGRCDVTALPRSAPARLAARGTATGVRSVHRNQRGNITLIFMFFSLAMFIAVAMCWNTAHATRVKMHAQTAADSAAYSAATWTSRTTNIVTGSNMLVNRHAGAMVAATAAITTYILVPLNWIQWVNSTCSGTGPFYPICAAAAALSLIPEYIAYGQFIAQTAPGLGVLGQAPNRMRAIFNHAKAWVDATPGAIDSQREIVEKYYGGMAAMAGLGSCDIHLVQPGGGSSYRGRPASGAGITAPVETGNFLTILMPLIMRWYISKDNGWGSDNILSQIARGKGKQSWNIGSAIGLIVGAAVASNRHYVLKTQTGPLEWGPSSLTDWRDFSVVAMAQRKQATGISTPRPGRPGGRFFVYSHLMANGLFNAPIVRDDTVIAYAQAETYNGIDGYFRDAIGVNLPISWRVWSTWGWMWQPRLHRGDQLKHVMQTNTQFRNKWNSLRINSSSTNNWARIEDAAMH